MKNLVRHSASVDRDVVADHGVDHGERHEKCEDDILKFGFWHK